MSKFFKLLVGLVGAVFVGALGSGVWEKVLSPAINHSGEWIAKTLSGMSQSYSDSIYSAASNLHGGGYIAEVFTLAVMMMSFAMFFYGMHIFTRSNFGADSEDGKKIYACLSYMHIIGAFALFFIALFQGAKLKAVKDVRNYSLTNMEISRPYIGEHSYHLMMSQFLRVDNESDFKVFVELLRKNAREAGVVLSAYRPG